MYKEKMIDSIKNMISQQRCGESLQLLEKLYLQYVGREGLDEEEVRNGYVKDRSGIEGITVCETQFSRMYSYTDMRSTRA